MVETLYILWDFDGTLAYRDGMWTDALLSVLIKNNITNIQKEDIRPLLNIGFSWHSPDTPHSDLFLGKSWWEYYEIYFQEIYEKIGIDTVLSKKMCKEVRNEYLDIKKWHIYSDTESALNKMMQSNYKNVILSNHVPELSEIVKNMGIEKYFFKIYSSGIIGYEKPNKKIYDFVINDLNANRNNCIMIGDSYDADIAGAIRSYIKPILVRKENTKNYKWFCNNLDSIQETIESVYKSEKKSPNN
jgi:putative hydrolase of the HAD superfamily